MKLPTHCATAAVLWWATLLLHAGDFPGAAAKKEMVTSADVETWSVVQTVAWAGSLGIKSTDKLTAAIAEHQITGDALMMLDDQILEEEFEIFSSLDRKRIMAAIQSMRDLPVQTEVDNRNNMWNEYRASVEGPEPGFWKLRNVEPQRVDYIVSLIVGAPRTAMREIRELPEFARPSAEMDDENSVVFAWIEWIYFPELHVITERNNIMGGLPRRIYYTCILNFLLKIITFMKSVKKDGFIMAAMSLALGVMMIEFFGGWINYFFYTYAWPILPWFVSGFFFWSTVYIEPISQSIKLFNAV